MSGNPAIYLEKDGPIGWLVLNQPDKRNALSQAMWDAIPALLDQAADDKAIRVVVVRGVDHKAFAAGADISEFEKVHATPDSSKAYNRIVQRAERRLSRFAKPTIAMIQGPCVGGGCGVAVACDLRFADDTARFGIPPAKLGLVYSLHDTKLVVDKIGPARAMDMLYTGRLVDAPEALRIGLIDRLLSPAAIEAETRSYCEMIAQSSQFSVRATKRIVRMILD
ncbi:MAG: enoyl-CoA hydratase/isomerase family protein, partial [Alphaproteobacteria bacterium]|nr:enoyl-CoA hydratase/isomerase family protein [Alphaproteobacteria bacterium]